MTADRRRLFFALWPDRRTRRNIAARTRIAVAASQGRATAVANLHLTLAFLGAVDPARLQPIIEAVADRKLSAPPMRLTRIGYWRGSRILWLAPDPLDVDPIVTLAGALWTALESLGFAREKRPCKPHVTLARNAQLVKTAAIEPIDWPMPVIILAESLLSPSGARYRVLHRFDNGPPN